MKNISEAAVVRALWCVIAAPFVTVALVAVFGATPWIAVPFVLLFGIVLGIRGVLRLAKGDRIVSFEQRHPGLGLAFFGAFPGSPGLIAVTQIATGIAGICGSVFLILRISG
jgi:hypothetical protein